MSYANQRWLNKDFFQEGQEVMVFHTQLRVIPAELWCECKGLYTLRKVFYDGALELLDEDERVTKVSKQRGKHFIENRIEELHCFTRTRIR